MHHGNTIFARFDDHKNAERAMGALLDHGLDQECVSLVRGGNEHSEGTAEHGITTTTAEDATSGAVKGAGVGLAVGALGALASLMIPGFGLVLGGGALATALAAWAGTTAAGAVAGGVTGFLKDQGIEEHAARNYEESLNRGGAMIAVNMAGNGNINHTEIENILRKYNASDVHHGTGINTAVGADTMQTAMPSTPIPSTPVVNTPISGTMQGHNLHEGQTIPVVEEELAVGKRQVEKGGVRVESRIVETPVEEQVTLREEHVRVERRPVNRPATEADFTAFEEGSIELRETAEEAVVQKHARVVEEVVVNKGVTEHVETIRDTVRHTDVNLEQLETEFRTDYNTRYAKQGQDFGYYQPAYQYGHELATDGRYTNKRWEDFETDASSRWSKRYPQTTWESVKDAVRYGHTRGVGVNR